MQTITQNQQAAVTALETSYYQILTRIQEITASPNPNVSIDGESYSKASYLETLNAQLLEVEKAIQRATGPFCLRTRGRI